MFSKLTTRIGKTAALGLIVATVGLGLFGGTGSAFARDNVEGAGASCMHAGVEYSEGAIVRMDNGALYQCKNGAWVFYCGGCATGNATIGNGGVKGPRAVLQQPGVFQLQMAP